MKWGVSVVGLSPVSGVLFWRSFFSKRFPDCLPRLLRIQAIRICSSYPLLASQQMYLHVKHVKIASFKNQ